MKHIVVLYSEVVMRVQVEAESADEARNLVMEGEYNPEDVLDESHDNSEVLAVKLAEEVN